jgi:hypothetical protein
MYKEIEEAPGIYIYDDGRIWSKKQQRFLSTSLDEKGYVKVSLWVDKKVKTMKIHRLVAKYFVPNPYNYKEVNHKDEDKTNNCVSNLEWCTRKYNVNYGSRLRKVSQSMLNNTAISKRILQYDKNGNFINEYPSAHEAARQLGKISVHGYQNILMCAWDKTKTAYGYIWKFADEKKLEELIG